MWGQFCWTSYLSLSDLPLQHVRQGIIYMYNLLYMYVCVLTWIYIYYSHVQLIYPWYEGEFECCANDLVASRRGYSDRCMQFSNAMGQLSANYFQFNIPFHFKHGMGYCMYSLSHKHVYVIHIKITSFFLSSFNFTKATNSTISSGLT